MLVLPYNPKSPAFTGGFEMPIDKYLAMVWSAKSFLLSGTRTIKRTTTYDEGGGYETITTTTYDILYNKQWVTGPFVPVFDNFHQAGSVDFWLDKQITAAHQRFHPWDSRNAPGDDGYKAPLRAATAQESMILEASGFGFGIPAYPADPVQSHQLWHSWLAVSGTIISTGTYRDFYTGIVTPTSLDESFDGYRYLIEEQYGEAFCLPAGAAMLYDIQDVNSSSDDPSNIIEAGLFKDLVDATNETVTVYLPWLDRSNYNFPARLGAGVLASDLFGSCEHFGRNWPPFPGAKGYFTVPSGDTLQFRGNAYPIITRLPNYYSDNGVGTTLEVVDTALTLTVQDTWAD